MPRHNPWYHSYDTISEQVVSAKAAFDARCKKLGHASSQMLIAFNRDSLARTVHESNWQEGVQLEFGRTKELAELVMDDLRFQEDSRLDLQGICEIHRKFILEMKRRDATTEEIATASLARAHMLVRWISTELSYRQSASLAHALRTIDLKLTGKESDKLREMSKNGMQIVEELLSDPAPVYAPLQGSFGSSGELLDNLLKGSIDTLMKPMSLQYVHALHRVAMMGVLPASQLGRWRRSMVHVGNPDLVFPPPEAIDSLMEEFRAGFPTILPQTVKYDPIRVAARTSYQFVRIHPYTDGNGRVSRLIANLVLYGHHPFVSLAPRSKERHRYRTALKQADRGKLEPMECLIGIAVRDTYIAMVDALGGYDK